MKEEIWDEKEIKKAAKIILAAEKKKSFSVRILDEIIHWLLILLIVFGNVVISGFLVVLSGVTDVFRFYIILVVAAAVFGFLIGVPITDIEKLDKGKHFIISVLLPLLALLNIYVMMGMKYLVEQMFEKTLSLNAMIAGIVYVAFFLLPHYTGYILRK